MYHLGTSGDDVAPAGGIGPTEGNDLVLDGGYNALTQCALLLTETFDGATPYDAVHARNLFVVATGSSPAHAPAAGADPLPGGSAAVPTRRVR